jgi:hypothetical protein
MNLLEQRGNNGKLEEDSIRVKAERERISQRNVQAFMQEPDFHDSTRQSN